MNKTEFSLLKNYIYSNCVDRVENRRLSEDPVQPQYALCPNDKPLVSNFFNKKLGKNNKYLVTKKLLSMYSDNTEELTGAVPVFGFTDEHEVLWGDDEEFLDNLYDIYIRLFIDLLNSNSVHNALIKMVLCDNIIFAKYSTLYDIKHKYKISLLDTFAVRDEMVSKENMNTYLKIALKHLYERPKFKDYFYEKFYKYTFLYKDFTNIDDRLMKHFVPDLVKLLESYTPQPQSLGLRVQTLISYDLIKVLDQLDETCNLSSKEYELNKKIIHASSLYISSLEDIAFSMLE